MVDMDTRYNTIFFPVLKMLNKEAGITTTIAVRITLITLINYNNYSLLFNISITMVDMDTMYNTIFFSVLKMLNKELACITTIAVRITLIN